MFSRLAFKTKGLARISYDCQGLIQKVFNSQLLKRRILLSSLSESEVHSLIRHFDIDIPLDIVKDARLNGELLSLCSTSSKLAEINIQLPAVKADLLIGKIAFFNEQGVPEDILTPKATHASITGAWSKLHSLLKEADSGSAVALCEIAKIYLDPNSALYDPGTALTYLKLAANQNHAESCYLYGCGGSLNWETSLMYANLKPNAARNPLKVTAADAYRYFKLAAVQGHAAAQNAVADCLYYGEGVQSNELEAFEYMKRSADQGYPSALKSVGSCYMEGVCGVTKNLEEGFKYYKLGADQGDAESQNNLAMCYAKGEGVTKNMEEAFKYLVLSAAQDHAAGLTNLATFYENGYVVSADEVKAFQLHRQAADKGSANSLFELGQYYEKGKGGVNVNGQQAYTYYQRAAAGGHNDASIHLNIVGKYLLGYRPYDDNEV